MSWTNSLKSITLSEFSLIEFVGVSEDSFIDAFAEYAPLSYLSDNDDHRTRSMLAAAQIAHDMYQGADCDSYSDNNLIPKGSCLVGKLTIDVLDAGMSKKLDIITLIHSSTQIWEGNKHRAAHIRGLFGGPMISCLAADDFNKTFRHETLHAVRHALSHVKEAMYGESEAIKEEETMTHIVSDHLDKFISMKDLTLETKVVPLASSLPKDKRSKVRAEVTMPVDLKYKGKSVVRSNITLNAADSSLKEFINKTMEEYNL